MIPLQFRVKLTSICACEKNEQHYFFYSLLSNERWSRHAVFSKWKSERCPFNSLLCPRIRWKPRYHFSLYKTKDQFLTNSTFLTYSFISSRGSYYSKISMHLLKARKIVFPTMSLVTIIDWVSTRENTSKHQNCYLITPTRLDTWKGSMGLTVIMFIVIGSFRNCRKLKTNNNTTHISPI